MPLCCWTGQVRSVATREVRPRSRVTHEPATRLRYTGIGADGGRGPSHNCVRHGTSSLHAALDLATGKVIGLFARMRAPFWASSGVRSAEVRAVQYLLFPRRFWCTDEIRMIVFRTVGTDAEASTGRWYGPVGRQLDAARRPVTPSRDCFSSLLVFMIGQRFATARVAS